MKYENELLEKEAAEANSNVANQKGLLITPGQAKDDADQKRKEKRR